MNVSSIMKKDVVTCTPGDDVAAVASMMRDRRIGFVPVVDSHGSIVGVVTDRDLCLVAAKEKTRTTAHIAVSDAMTHPVFSCFGDENLNSALASMAEHQVRRLPVIDDQGHLKGVLSIDDIALAVRQEGAPAPEDIVETIKTIVARRPVTTAV